MWYISSMICTKCKQDKSAQLFSRSKTRKSGIRAWCKECERLSVKSWHAVNHTKASTYMKKYYILNKKKIKDYVREYSKNRRHNDINYRILINLRRRLNNAVHGYSKSDTTIRLLGCQIIQLRTHLQNKFKPRMSWSNYGKWHIDHKEPLCKFDLSNYEQLKKACHYSNLQPLWAEDNLRKGDKYGS